MIAIVKHAFRWIAETFKFTLAVWHDARAMQAEAEAKYGYSSF